MMRIYSAKQVGDLSYFVKDLNIFYNIILYQRIKQSNNLELNPRTGKKSYYVSLSRSMTAAAIRNNKRWKYGIVVDGNKLSNRYHIEPFSFTGSSLNQGQQLRVKTLTSYDDGECKLTLVNWPTMTISSETYDFIKNLIESQDDEFNRSHKLVYQDAGKRKVNGHIIKEKYNYNVKHGDSGKLLSDVKLPSEILMQLTKGENTNEYEERVWTSSEYINISGCIKGIILPKSEISDFESDDREMIADIREVLDTDYDSYSIQYY